MVYLDTRSQQNTLANRHDCELKAGGREVCTSELQVEYTQMIEGNLKIWGVLIPLKEADRSDPDRG